MATESNRPISAVICLALFAFGAPRASADTYPRQQGVKAVHYSFRLTLSDTTDEIVGEATADIRFVQDGVSQFALDLASAANGKGMTVADVTSGGKAVPYAHTSDRLVITLDAPSKAGERRQFVIHYRGVPAGGLRIIKNKYGERCFFSENWPNRARQWLPMIDHPYDKATSEFIIIAPDHYQVIANGSLVEETDLGNGTRLTHWKRVSAHRIVAERDRSGAVRHALLRGFRRDSARNMGLPPGSETLGISCLRNARAAGDRVLQPTRGAVSVREARQRGGGRNPRRHRTRQRDFLRRRLSDHNCESARAVAHEIAHQWFGDSVTEKDWDDVWLSEGFATYFYTDVYRTLRWPRRVRRGTEAKQGSGVREREPKIRRLAVIHDNLSDMTQVLNRLVYEKGGWSLHMLRCQIGDDKFWSGIRDYYQRYQRTECVDRRFQKSDGRELGSRSFRVLSSMAEPGRIARHRRDVDLRRRSKENRQSFSRRRRR